MLFSTFVLWILPCVLSSHFYSNQIAVKIEGGSEKAKQIAKRHSCEYIGPIGSLEDHYLLEHQRIAKRAVEDSSAAHQSLTDDPEVLWLEQQIVKPRPKRDFLDGGDGVPFPAFRPSSGNGLQPMMKKKQTFFFKDPLYPQQWYLHHGAHGNFDMNVEKAWRRNYSGKGISVSILDDGLQPNHPDIAQNYDPLASLDINGHDLDPTPTDDGNNKHGTRCAGEVSAVAGNDYCGVGIAYNSSIGGESKWSYALMVPSELQIYYLVSKKVTPTFEFPDNGPLAPEHTFRADAARVVGLGIRFAVGRLVSVRMLDGDVHDSVEATALSLNPQHVHIYSASWGPNDDGQTVDGPGPLAKKAFEDGINKGRNGLGSVFVWASGNGGKSQDSCSCDGYTNSIYTISISSASQDGTRPWYLEECPSTLAATYSSGNSMQASIVTVDLNTPGNGMRPCTNKHTGTSASAPLAAGIYALVLEANRDLNWRDLQYITLLAARPEPLIETWTINGVGRKVSTKFGYGLMDADKMVQLAEKWTHVPPQHVCRTEKFAQETDIKSGSLAVQVTSDACQNNPTFVRYLEHVQVVLSIRALHRGTIVIKVTSPMGTTSEMLHERGLDTSNQGFNEWPFMSVQFWGENPAGVWKVEIMDTSANNPYQGNPNNANSALLSWSVVLYGTDQDPIPAAAKELLIADQSSPTSLGSGEENVEPATAAQEPKTAQQTASMQCHITCLTCHGPHFDQCNSCFKNNYIHNSHCLLSCPTGFYPVNSTMTCTSCPSKCTQCFTAGVCMACQAGYTLTNGQCVAVHPAVDDECLHGYYFDHRITECKPCHTDCLTCSGPLPKDCLLCKPPKVFYSGCVEKCPGNLTADDGTCLPSNFGRMGNFTARSPSSTSNMYFLTATIACTVIVSIGLVVFCCLQAMSNGNGPRNRLLGGGPKYEKAPLKPVDDDLDDESDEEVETFSKRRLSEVLANT